MNAAEVRERFESFHEDNPQVARMLEDLVREKVARGATRIGSRALFERLRWEFDTNSHDGTYKLNNSFTPHYARLLIERHPEWAGLFEFRSRNG